MPTLEATPAPSTLAVELTRIIRAPRSRVYQAWTNPEILKKWFGPAHMHCTTAKLDARLGGEYSIGVLNDAAPEQPESVASGNYTKIVADKLLQFTWNPSWNPGEQSLVTVSFDDAPNGTEIAIRHENFADAAREGYTRGWTGCLDNMEVVVAPADYARSIEINAPAARVFEAISTAEGVRSWWATNVTGSGEKGGDLSLVFEGHEEPFVMHVDEATQPATVQWTSRFNSTLPEWAGTKIVFNIVERTPETCELNFRHIGLTPQLECYGQCEAGWNHFLPSLVAYAERGEGTPYRKPRKQGQAA